MTVTVQSVLDRVQQTLQDTAGIRWSSTNELVLWVNDAQREIALYKPDATATNAKTSRYTIDFLFNFYLLLIKSRQLR